MHCAEARVQGTCVRVNDTKARRQSFMGDNGGGGGITVDEELN